MFVVPGTSMHHDRHFRIVQPGAGHSANPGELTIGIGGMGAYPLSMSLPWKFSERFKKYSFFTSLYVIIIEMFFLRSRAND
jgi:hypothetical protein